MLPRPTTTLLVLVSVTYMLGLSPGATNPKARLAGETVRPSVVPFGVPVPVNATVWVPVGRVKVSVPVRVPVAVGAKVTLMVQLLPAAIELKQLWVCVKSPLVAIPLMVTAGAVLAPVPLRLTICEPEASLSVTTSVPVRVPVAWGVNETLRVQLVATATADPQLL